MNLKGIVINYLKDYCKPKGYCNMIKLNNILLDVNEMKKYAKNVTKEVTNNITYFNEVDELALIDAVITRFRLDLLLLDKQNVIDKWGQLRKERVDEGLYEFMFVLPDDERFNWELYFEKIREKCGNKDFKIITLFD